MKEKRIYVVCTACPVTGTLFDFTLSDVIEWDDDKFIEEAENQGWWWSSILSFAEDWNGNSTFMPCPDTSVMRII